MAARWPGRPVVGVDVAEPYLRFAAARPGAAGIDLRRGDAQALPFDDATFSGVGSLLLLNFVKEPLRAALEMRRVAVSGGMVATAGWDFRGGLVYQRILWDTAAVLDPEAGRRRAALLAAPLGLPDGLPDLFRAAGLADVARRSVTIRMEFKDFDDYWRPMDTGQGPVGGYLAALAPGRKTTVREAVTAAFLAGAPDGPRSLTATAWMVTGRVP
jgi:hypothetical protein